MTVASFIKDNATKVYKNFAGSPGKLLLYTGTIGWILSSLGQLFAITINDKIPNNQKKFLIPQEMADAAVNIASFFALTLSVTKFGEHMVKSGKLATPAIRKHLAKLGLDSKVGNKGFDITKLPEMQELNPKFNKEFQGDYYKFADGISFVSSTIGSIISCNIITPILRNKFAAARQKEAIKRDKMDKEPILIPDSPVLPTHNKPDNDKRVKLASVTPAPRITTGGSMKI